MVADGMSVKEHLAVLAERRPVSYMLHDADGDNGTD